MRHIVLVVVFALIVGSAGMSLAVPRGKKVVFPGGEKGKVVFDGTKHADAGITCEECHLQSPTLFQMKTGADQITMKDMHNDRYCGSCHNGKRAFDNSQCNKCHIKSRRR